MFLWFYNGCSLILGWDRAGLPAALIYRMVRKVWVTRSILMLSWNLPSNLSRFGKPVSTERSDAEGIDPVSTASCPSYMSPAKLWLRTRPQLRHFASKSPWLIALPRRHRWKENDPVWNPKSKKINFKQLKHWHFSRDFIWESSIWKGSRLQ